MIEIYQRHALPTAQHGRGRIQENEILENMHVPIAESTPVGNPIIHVYVFPHVSTADGLRVPGYWTSLRLFDRNEVRTDSIPE